MVKIWLSPSLASFPSFHLYYETNPTLLLGSLFFEFPHFYELHGLWNWVKFNKSMDENYQEEEEEENHSSTF